jgi:hypothetical protein
MIEKRLGIAIVRVARGRDGGNPNAEPVRANGLRTGFGDFEQQPRAVFDRAAVGVGPMIGAIAKEGVEQISVGAVQFHAVEAGVQGPHRGKTEIGDDAGNFYEVERTRRRAIDEALTGDESLGVGLNGRRANRRLAVFLEAGVRHPTRVPQLYDDGPALGMHRVSNLSPAGDLRVAIAAGRAGVALRLGGNLGRLGDDQARGRALAIVVGRESARRETWAGAVAGQRRHDNPVGELESSNLHTVKQRLCGAGLVCSGHGGSPGPMAEHEKQPTPEGGSRRGSETTHRLS